MRVWSSGVVVLSLFACLVACAGQRGGAAESVSSPPPSQASEPTGSARAPAAASSSPPSVGSKPRPDASAIFARLKPDLVRCYEQGKKSVPTMLDGKLTMNASIDASGKTTCVIPTEDKGLTQEVEDCMSARFASEKFDEGTTATAIVPVAVRAGVVELGERKAEVVAIESVETYRMPDAFDVLESLEPELQACVRAIDRSAGVRAVIVGARVGTDGRTSCALASTPSGVLPPKAADCAANVFRQAKFPPPKGGNGLVLVPITLMR